MRCNKSCAAIIFIIFSTLPAETQVTFPDGKVLGLNTLFPLRYTYAKHTRASEKLGMLLLSYPGEQGDAYGKRGVPILPEALAIHGVPLLCVRGTEEPVSLCPLLPPGHATQLLLSGGHHFGGDYDAIGKAILDAAGH